MGARGRPLVKWEDSVRIFKREITGVCRKCRNRSKRILSCLGATSLSSKEQTPKYIDTIDRDMLCPYVLLAVSKFRHIYFNIINILNLTLVI